MCRTTVSLATTGIEDGTNLSTAAITTVKEVFDLLRDELGAMEQEFERLSASEVDSITEMPGTCAKAAANGFVPPCCCWRQNHWATTETAASGWAL